ncbi:gliding motility-associated C-terminal domain-containing protein [Saprospiraceae bacterium]|nr:gliding motility-associated C-terminal domain-containing protein [Saprospiraceae bacterium]
MKRIFIFYFLFFLSSSGFSQVYVSTLSDNLYRLDIENCNYDFVVHINNLVFDIAFHPNGNLYGIEPFGNFYQIDTLTGNTSLVTDFNGQIFNSLTIDSDSVVYATGDEGELYSYDFATDTETFHGAMGYVAMGDLTFFEGNLYAAISGDRILLVDINNPPNSSVVIDGNVPGDIFGIVTHAEDCSDINSYAITDGNSRIYEIDFETNSLTFVCGLDIEVGGGASTFEYIASIEAIALQNVNVTNSICENDDGSITIIANGGSGQLEYSIDGVNFQTSNVFENLPAGVYSITIRDENNCTFLGDVEVIAEESPEITGIFSLNSTCGNDNGSMSILVDGGTGQLLYSINGVNFQTSNFFENLPEGTYSITVTDENNCFDLGTEEILSQESPVITEVTSLDPTCGNANGSITVTINGGTGLVVYSLDGFFFQISNVFTNLPEGIYSITIRDENGCTDLEDVLLESQEAPLIVDVSATNTVCGNETGTITILAFGGTGQLEYSIDGINFQTNNVFDDLPTGDYTIIINDENNCTDIGNVEVFSEGSPTILEISTISPTCGNENGSITIEADGGTGTLEYSIDGINFQPSNVFDNLPVGNYALTIRDENLCAFMDSLEILSVDQPIITDVASLDTTCGDENGSINVSADGGIGQLQYSIDGINFQTSNVFDSLPVGDYTITIMDENNCTDIENIELFAESSPNITEVSSTNTICGSETGSITILANGGTGQLEFSIDGINFQVSNVFENLPTGIYSVIILDENNCSDLMEAQVFAEDAPIITEVSSIGETCGNENGSITIIANGGSGQLEYSIDGINFQTSNTFTDLPADIYSITIRDENNCDDLGSTEIIAQNAPIITELSSINTTCGNENGTITILANNGTGEIEYSIDGINFQTSNVFDNLPTGSYSVTIRDENNCTSLGIAEIQAIDVPIINELTSTNTVCGDETGSITILANGGTGQLEYSIDGVNFQTTNVFDNLPSGDYIITIRDENNCDDVGSTEIMAEDAPIISEVSTISATCGNENGTITVLASSGTGQLEYSIDGINFQTSNTFIDLPADNYSITIRDENQCTDLSEVEISTEDSPNIEDVSSTSTICGDNNGSINILANGGIGDLEYSIDGLNFQASSDFENLAAGEYQIIVQDLNSCQDTQTVTVLESLIPSIQSFEETPTSCGEANGAIIIEVNSGDNVEFSIDGNSYQQENIFTELASGNYTLSVRDENGCVSTNEAVIANSFSMSVGFIESESAFCEATDGAVTVDVFGGTGIIQIALNGGIYQSDLYFEGLSAGAYEIQIIDEVECMIDTSLVINQEDCPIYIPNAFSPNDDGVNDLFKIYPHSAFMGEFILFRIYDRWGSNLFEAQNFDPTEIGWDGTFNGSKVGSGVYVYFVEYLSEDGNIEILKGDVTISR